MTEFPAVYPEREPEHIDPSDGSIEWRGCRITFNRDIPDDSGCWGIDYKDGIYIRDLPQALVELLIDKHYEDILKAIES